MSKNFVFESRVTTLHTRCDFNMHYLEACLVACASTYTREHIYATHVLVTVLCGSVLCASCKNTYKRSRDVCSCVACIWCLFVVTQ